MKRKYLLLNLIFCFTSILTGCYTDATRTSDSNLIKLDNFSDNHNRWNTWVNTDGSGVSFYQGGLAFVINSAQKDYLSVIDESFTNSKIEVTTKKIVGSDENDFGIVCRYLDEDNYYAFIISSSGFYGLLKVINGEYALINESSSLISSEEIRKASESNHLGLDCIGSVLTFYVNSIKFGEVIDNDLHSGKVGLIAGTYEDPGIAILFDDFSVNNP